jgi:hypothetical protein
MLRIVTDSASQLPAELRDRYEVSVVAMVIALDGHQYREGINLPGLEFYERVAAGATVSTAAPSPGEVTSSLSVRRTSRPLLSRPPGKHAIGEEMTTHDSAPHDASRARAPAARDSQ